MRSDERLSRVCLDECVPSRDGRPETDSNAEILAGAKTDLGDFSAASTSQIGEDLGSLLNSPRTGNDKKLETSRSESKNELWRRVAIGFIGTIVLYCGVSYFAVPIIVERLLVSTVSEELGLEARMKAVEFNPLTARLSIQEFVLPDVDSEDVLFSFDELVIDLRPLGFFEADVVLDEVLLVRPKLWVTIDAEGKLRLAELIVADEDNDSESDADDTEDAEEQGALIVDIRPPVRSDDGAGRNSIVV